MSNYTTEVRFLCEYYAGLRTSVDYPDVNKVLVNCIPKMFDFEWPIFDETYRHVLEIKILKHYYTREIAFETPGLWKLKLDTKLNEIMPFYNQLYESALIDFNPMYNVDTTSDHVGDATEGKIGASDGKIVGNVTGSGKVVLEEDTSGGVKGKTDRTDLSNTVSAVTAEQTDEGTSKSDVKDVKDSTDVSTINKLDAFSDTPQGAVSDLQSMKYLTNARTNKDDATTTLNITGNVNSTGNTVTTLNGKTDSSVNLDHIIEQTDSVDSTGTKDQTTVSESLSDSEKTSKVSTTMSMTNTDNYVRHVRGKQGAQSYSYMLTEFRNTFLNIDMMVIEELQDLFFTLY